MAVVGNVDYSPYAMKEGEDLYDYLARLSVERKGGILGTGGLMDVPSPKKVEAKSDKNLGSASYSCPPGYTWNGTACVPVSDDTETAKTLKEQYLESDEYNQGFSYEDFKMQNALDRLTGRRYAGQGLWYGIPTPLSNWSDKAEIKSQLLANGFSEAEADRMINDPEFASATNMLGRLGTMPTKEYDYKQQNTEDSLFDVGKSVVGSVFGLDKDTGYSRQSPFMTSEQYNTEPYKGLPLLSNGRTAQIVAAQNAALFDPLSLFDADAVAKQAIETQQAALAAQVERERKATAAAAAAAASRSSSGSTTSSYDAGSRNAGQGWSGGSTTNYASGGGTSTVGTGGGNASRGFSFGGW